MTTAKTMRTIARGGLFMGALALVIGAGTGCTVKDQPNYLIAPQINHMMFSKAVESQVATDLFENGRTLQHPPAGTLPRGHVRTHFPVDMATAKAMGKVDKDGKADFVAVAQAQAKKAGEALTNPVEATDENVARGKVVFNTFCSPCHGESGMGDGPVATRGVGMPGYPLTAKGSGPMTYKDGHIFHIITYGRGNMGSYASQIAPTDRWKAVLWLRKLQKGGVN
ncbi:MAG: cytochrome c [Myxococcales bacterium]|nr:cytochrome c [Myxococcales bacterium]